MLAELSTTLIEKSAAAILTRIVASATPKIAATVRDALLDKKAWTFGSRIKNLQSVRTLFSSYKNVSIDDFYYRTTVSDSESRSSVIDSLDQLVPGSSYVITGTAGQGKSILARRLCLQQAREMADGRLPIFIALGEIDSIGHSLTQAIADRFADLGVVESGVRVHGYAQSAEVIEHFFSTGRAVIILDGFDEVNSERQGPLVRALEGLRQKFPSLQIVVTSRPDTPICHSSAFTHLQVDNLTGRDLRPFLEKLIKKKSIVDSLVEGVQAESPELRSVLATPLMITLLAIVYLSVRKVPPRLVEFYGHIFDVLLYRHDVTKGGGFKRERFSRFGESELSEVFRAISFVARSQQLAAFRRDEWRDVVIKSLELIQDWNAPQKRFADMRRRARGLTVAPSVDPKREVEPLRQEATKNLCLLVEDGANLVFIHKTIAEYLSAEFIRGADEEFALAFYESLQESLGSYLQPELQFLAEIDTKRYVRLFWSPEFRKWCSQKRLVPKKGKDNKGILEYSSISQRLILDDVIIGFWLDEKAAFPAAVRIERADQIVLPSTKRPFDATFADLWEKLAVEVAHQLAKNHNISLQTLIDADVKNRERADLLKVKRDYRLDPSLAWFSLSDLLDLGLAYGSYTMTHAFIDELALRWRSFRSVEKSEERRRDFLVTLQKKARKPKRPVMLKNADD